MKFFKKKFKFSNRGSDGTVSLASKTPSDSPSKTLSKSSRTSKFSKSSKSTKISLPIDQPVEEINDQGIEVLSPTLQYEARDDTFFINSIITSSGSTETEEDEMSNITFDAQGTVEKTSPFKQFLVDHLLGCVDFVEECAATVKDTRNDVNESNDNRLGADNVTEKEPRELAPPNETPPLSTQTLTCSAIQDLGTENDGKTESGVIADEQREVNQPETSRVLCNVDLPGTSATQDAEICNDLANEEGKSNGPTQIQDPGITPMVHLSKVQQIDSTSSSHSPAASSNDLIELDYSVPKSSYENVTPKTLISLQTNNDFLLAATNIDAIIDSHVSRMCEQMCICSELGLCGGDDDISQFQELPLVSNGNENLLFQ